MEPPKDGSQSVVPDPSLMTHEALVLLMKKDAERQEPLVTVIAQMLEETVLRNEQSSKKSTLPSFQGKRPPLSACAFVTRVAKYSGASPCCFAVGLIYLERMKKRDPGVCLTPTNFQRLFLISVMTAAKFLDDFYYSNKHWAEVGGLTTQEVNKLELEFLFRMGFSLHMQREEYDWYAEELHSRVQQELKIPAPAAPSAADANPSTQPPQQHVEAAAVPKAVASGKPVPPAPGPQDMESFLSANTTPSSSIAHIQHMHAMPGGVPAHPPQPPQAGPLKAPAGGDKGNGMDWVYC
mmetsp:Transcript_13399/g.31415  ORF Transcript_13399/g.31415 Transcript_13399/m.31415 type:complete len:294 (-) Transcript_13399:90-971(-)